MRELSRQYKDKSIKSTVYQSAGAGLLSVPGIKAVFDALRMGADGTTPAAPVYYVRRSTWGATLTRASTTASPTRFAASLISPTDSADHSDCGLGRDDQ